MSICERKYGTRLSAVSSRSSGVAMHALEKFRESLYSVLPVILLVLLLHWTVAPIPELLCRFLIGGLLLILGLSVFLLGTEIGMVPIGQKAGAALTSRKNLPLLIGMGFVIGFLVTVAEPDVQVLAVQVAGVDASIPPSLLVSIIAMGVGLFVSVAMGRIILGLSLRLLLTLFYILVFGCAYFTNPAFLGIAFDAGGATTGPMTVPFIMALGLGVAAVRGDGNAGNDSFGFIGLASIGPIVAVLVLGLVFTGGQGQNLPHVVEEAVSRTTAEQFLHLVPEVGREVSAALGPLVFLFILFQFWLLRMPPMQVLRMCVGLVYTFIGLVLFFVGVKGGFMPAGAELGAQIALLDSNEILIPIGLVIGAVVVCAEPAVWVLNAQVEQVSGGHIRKNVMLVSLSAGVACSVAIAMTRVLLGLSIWWFLIPGYVLALGMSRFCPQIFTAVAFDSGGVASGPMASTFILAFTLGASKALGGNPITDAFGVIAMIAMTPLITIQILGILYGAAQRRSRTAQRTPDETGRESRS